jgi:PAP2 superfamily C-terminal
MCLCYVQPTISCQLLMHASSLTNGRHVCQQAAHSCGDLLFSSHTIFVANGALTYSVYGSHLAIKAVVWLAVTCICGLIIASRKHYTGMHACIDGYMCANALMNACIA